MAASVYEFNWWSKDEEGAVVPESPIKVVATCYETALNIAVGKAKQQCNSYNKAPGFGQKCLHEIKIAA